ncbi:MAG: hypothetical protein K0Q68_1658 [Moraxellaceae bacterium]|jgi:hypothetical protein|nr:hypothetical protein [Moraxellaceae bacterium]
MHKAVALLLLAASLPAGAEIYKWTDAQGRVHFGDSAAGTGKPAEAIETPQPGNTYGTDPERSARQRRLNQVLQAEAAEREYSARQAARQRDEREAQCQRLRHELQGMEGRATYYTDDNGERHFLDDGQRREHVASVNRQLKANCP